MHAVGHMHEAPRAFMHRMRLVKPVIHFKHFSWYESMSLHKHVSMLHMQLGVHCIQTQDSVLPIAHVWPRNHACLLE